MFGRENKAINILPVDVLEIWLMGVPMMNPCNQAAAEFMLRRLREVAGASLDEYDIRSLHICVINMSVNGDVIFFFPIIK